MADTIRIPHGFVIATDPEEWSAIVAACRIAIKIIEQTPQIEDGFNDKAFYEKLLSDLMSPKHSYGSEGTH